MATLADIRRAALALPGRRRAAFPRRLLVQCRQEDVRRSTGPSARWIFKLPKPRQELLFEARPDVFQPYRAGAMVWSYVAIEELTQAEVGSRHRCLDDRDAEEGGEDVPVC
jgi:hypothetical protein